MPASAPRSTTCWPALLAAAGVWAAVVPYAARALGLRVDVAASVEVVDHVVPGLVVLAAALLAAGRGRRAPGPGDVRWSVAAGAAFLAGFWIASTHAPLIAEAADGATPWGAALLHAAAALPALVLSVAMLLLPLARPR